MTVAAAGRGHANPALFYGPEVPFSFEHLKTWAAALAAEPYRPQSPLFAELIQRIDFDAYQQIRYRPEWALWSQGGARYPVELFHVGRYFQEPVRIFAVEAGMAREVGYKPDLFTYGAADFARALPPDTGFAGFRVMAGPNQPDWLSYLGASYFRSPGETRQYGLSARGLAINSGQATPEEFPRFIGFWLEEAADFDGIIVNCLLNSESVTGAYRMVARRQAGTIIDIELTLFPRRDVERVGIAPFSSMFWYGKHNRLTGLDWRPEIHDSDGLAIWTGTGERIWRPLNNPDAARVSSFLDRDIKGFGLLQRERRFEQYEDDGVFYNLRPSVWVEPVGAWGEGAVQLVELPTKGETEDNIVALWHPREPLRRNVPVSYAYRLHWRSDEPFAAATARVAAMRVGAGGVPGTPHREGYTKYVVDFEGGEMARLQTADAVVPVVTVSAGAFDNAACYRIVGTDRWRLIFDYRGSGGPADLRGYLAIGGRALSETWLYQHIEDAAEIAPPRPPAPVSAATPR